MSPRLPTQMGGDDLARQLEQQANYQRDLVLFLKAQQDEIAAMRAQLNQLGTRT